MSEQWELWVIDAYCLWGDFEVKPPDFEVPWMTLVQETIEGMEGDPSMVERTSGVLDQLVIRVCGSVVIEKQTSGLKESGRRSKRSEDLRITRHEVAP